jgi:preprotein translocase subunit SecD
LPVQRLRTLLPERSLGQIAIIVDGVVVSAPTVLEPIRTGWVSMTGNLSKRRAEALAAHLNSQ